jgi:F-type H+-transporting ATPase subunit b
MGSVHYVSDTLAVLVHDRGGDVNLDLDGTAFVQVGLFIALWLILKPLLFDPMLKLFDEREKRIEGNIAKARGIDEQSGHAKAEYDETLHKARLQGTADREKIRAEGIRQEAELLAKVRGETAALAAEARKKADEELVVAKNELGKEGGALARQLAGIVVGREVTG